MQSARVQTIPNVVSGPTADQYYFDSQAQRGFEFLSHKESK